MTTDDRFAALREYIAGRADNDDVLLNVQLVRELLDAVSVDRPLYRCSLHDWFGNKPCPQCSTHELTWIEPRPLT